MPMTSPNSWRMLTLGAVLGLGGAVVSRLPAILSVDEAVGLAALFALAPVEPPADDAAVIAISRSTFDALGLPDELDEWPRSVHALLVDRLADAGASVIAFDIAFGETRDASDDDQFADAIARAGNVLLLERTLSPRPAETAPIAQGGIGFERREPPTARLKQAALGSAPFVLPTVPVRLSQFWAFDRLGANWPSLPALALHAHALGHGADVTALLRAVAPALGASLDRRAGAGDLESTAQGIRDLLDGRPDLATELRSGADAAGVADAQRGLLLHALIDLYAGPGSGYLHYYGPARSLRSVPYERIIAGGGEGPPLELEGRAVFVGVAEGSQPDQLDDFYSVFSDERGRNLSGVEVGATAFMNLLRRELIVPLGIWPQLGLLTLWGVLVGALAMVARQPIALGLLVAAAAGYAGSAASAFVLADLWIPTFVPLVLQLPLALVLAAMWKFQLERARRRRVGAALTSYVPAAAVAGVEEQPLSRDAARALIDGVCLVSDAQGYTELAERLQPEALATLMNDYYDLLFGVVERHGGIVTDTAGDSMVAIWRRIDAGANASAGACRAALEIQRVLVEFNRAHPGTELVTGIGIEAGEMLMTNVGSGTRFNYRAVGDPVNTAARLQGLSRHLGCAVLVSAAAKAKSAELAWRALGRFRLAGKRRAIALYELSGGDASAPDAGARAIFEQALAEFGAAEWAAAARGFERYLRFRPEDGPAKFFLRQCREHAAGSLPADWDGSVTWLQK